MFTRYESAEILFEEAQKLGLAPQWETRSGLFSFEHIGQTHFVFYTNLHSNSQLGSQMCKNKSLTRAFLARESLPTIPSCHSHIIADINRFFDQHHPMIQKPLTGMRAQHVRLIRKRSEIDTAQREESIFERYIEGTEYRCLVLNQQTILMQKNTLTPTEDYPWKKRNTNLAKNDWLPDLLPIAERIATALHMGLIAVDFIIDTVGRAWILELNNVPGLNTFHDPHEGEPMNVAKMLLETMVAS